MSDRYLNMSNKDRARSEKFIKSLRVGQKLKPRYHHTELTVSSVMTQGHMAITFEESQWPIMYPLPDQFEAPAPQRRDAGFYLNFGDLRRARTALNESREGE